MQPNKIFKALAATAMMVFLAGGCTGSFEELNTNPSLLVESKVQPTVLFTC